MKKTTLGPKTFLYPMPTVLVGALVNRKPNYLAIAFCGIVNHDPPMISVSLGKQHYTNQGIRDNHTFSVNIPSVDMVEITDYCGITSGNRVDKSILFGTFYGDLETAPMIEECPLNLECRLVEIIDFGDHSELFVGEIVQTHIGEEYLTENLPDVRKMRPIVFTMHDNNYWHIGEHLAQAWHVGRDFKPKKTNGSTTTADD